MDHFYFFSLTFSKSLVLLLINSEKKLDINKFLRKIERNTEGEKIKKDKDAERKYDRTLILFINFEYLL